MDKSLLMLAVLLWQAAFVGGTCGRAAEPAPGPLPEDWPPVEQVSKAVRSVLPDLPAPPETATNAWDYVRSLAPRVLLATAETGAPEAVARTRVYASRAGYIRVGAVEAPLAAALAEAVDGLRRSNELAGLVLDLRFAGGRDFQAAAAAAGALVGRKVEGFRIGTNALPVEPRSGGKALPVIVLANRQTRGAAEVLAAAVRAGATPGLMIGANSAGEARVYRDLDLVGGRRLQVETDAAILGDRGAFPRDGLVPDLAIVVSEADEAGYFTNEFRRVVGGRPVGPHPAFRLNEAELVRRRRAGKTSADGVLALPPRDGAGRPGPGLNEEPGLVVQDPVLGRALDLISGLADQVTTGAGDSR